VFSWLSTLIWLPILMYANFSWLTKLSFSDSPSLFKECSRTQLHDLNCLLTVVIKFWAMSCFDHLPNACSSGRVSYPHCVETRGQSSVFVTFHCFFFFPLFLNVLWMLVPLVCFDVSSTCKLGLRP
jgi:hypothetical protein